MAFVGVGRFREYLRGSGEMGERVVRWRGMIGLPRGMTPLEEGDFPGLRVRPGGYFLCSSNSTLNSGTSLMDTK